MTAIYRLVYASKNEIDVPDAEMLAEVEQILAASQRNNAQCEVTGALLFNRGAFAQVLEGPQSGVEATFERIQRDMRHADVTVLQCGPTEERAFTNWSMAFVGQSAKGRALWDGLAARSGFDLSRLDGDDVFTMLHELVLAEEPVPSASAAVDRSTNAGEAATLAFDPEQVRAEIERLRPHLAGNGIGRSMPSITEPLSVFGTRSARSETRTSNDTAEVALTVLRAAILAERQLTTELRAALDEARIAIAMSDRAAEEMCAQRDLWADRARQLAGLIGAEAAELTRLAILKDQAA